MDKHNNQQENEKHEFAGREHGPQGIDKAPGEEPSADNVQFEKEAFKGKKVDGDPEQERDRPASQPSL